jgi:hypothetical protein
MEQLTTAKEKMNFVLIDSITLMNQHYVDEKNEQYFRAFEIAYQMVAGRLPIEDRQPMEWDYNAMKGAELRILNAQINEATKKNYIQMLHKEFADIHRFYIMRGLSKLGVTQQPISGELTVTKDEIDKITRIIRDNSGIETAIKQAEEVHGADTTA